jgi:hypothetical protein
VALEPTLIIELPQGGAVQRQLEERPFAAIGDGAVVVAPGPTDEEGNLEAAAAGEVVLSVSSPEALRQEAATVRRVIEGAGTGIEPLLLVVEAADELREDEVAPVLDAAEHAPRAVILRIVRDG